MSFEKQPLCCSPSIHVTGEDSAFKYVILSGELWEDFAPPASAEGYEWLK